MNEIERTIRDLQLYVDVKWGGTNDMLNLALTALKDFCKLQQENEQLKEQINTAKIGWDTYKTYSEQLEQQTAESNKIIETQQQEIEKLKATLADWKYNAKCDADHIAALTADKDEQTERMKYLLRRTLPILEVTNDQQELIDAINALIGGKEDEKE